MDEGGSLRDQCLRDKGNTDFHGKHSLDVGPEYSFRVYLGTASPPPSVWGDEEWADEDTEGHIPVNPLFWEMDLDQHQSKLCWGLN